MYLHLNKTPTKRFWIQLRQLASICGPYTSVGKSIRAQSQIWRFLTWKSLMAPFSTAIVIKSPILMPNKGLMALYRLLGLMALNRAYDLCSLLTLKWTWMSFFNRCFYKNSFQKISLFKKFNFRAYFLCSRGLKFFLVEEFYVENHPTVEMVQRMSTFSLSDKLTGKPVTCPVIRGT